MINQNKILVLGNGFIASHFPSYNRFKYLDKEHLDNYIFDNQITHIINTTGYCGKKNIDDCEIDKIRTYKANTIVPLEIAEVCAENAVYLINISSGCIFSGKSPNTCDSIDEGWKETDKPNPVSYYSQTKAATDILLSELPDVACLRIRMPISNQDHPRNLINKLIGYSKIIDIPNSMTFTEDLVRCVEWLLNNKLSGIFNVSNYGTLTSAEIMKEYQKYRPEHKFEIINEKQLNSLVSTGRSNCVLNNNKLFRAGFDMSNAGEMLEKTMKAYILGKEENGEQKSYG